MSDFELGKELRDAIVFESAWLYRTMQTSDEEKDEMLDFIKVVWNRGFQRTRLVGHFKELVITEEHVKEAAEFWSSKEGHVIDITGLSNANHKDKTN